MTAQLDQMQTQLLSQPPPSIILPRSEAIRYVEICELAEMMPPSAASSSGAGGGSNFLTQLLLSSSSSSGSVDGEINDSTSGNNVKKYASIIQMAFLLYLGEYTHARHLWRRLNNNNNSHNSSNDDEYKQLTMFWNAAKYCYLWNTGGIMSGLSTPPANTNGTDSNDEEEIRSNLPYSTLMLRSLQSNSESSFEPLATYSRELVSIFRYRVNERLRMSFDDIREEEFMLRMNLSNTCAGEEEDVLGRYGWKRIAAAVADNSAHLVPDREWKLTMQGGDDSTMTLSVDVDRIRQLSEVVMFLEQTKMNA
jgi:hypothetical protein